MIKKIILHISSILKIFRKDSSFLVIDYFSSFLMERNLRIAIIILFLILILVVSIIFPAFLIFLILYFLIYFSIGFFKDITYKNSLKQGLLFKSKIEETKSEDQNNLNKPDFFSFNLSFYNYYSFYQAINILKFSEFNSLIKNFIRISYDCDTKEIKLFFEISDNDNELDYIKLFDLILNKIHACNFVCKKIEIDRKNKKYYLKKIKHHVYRGLLFSLARDQNIKTFNTLFNPKEKKKQFKDIKMDLKIQLKRFDFLYSTAYLGYGLNIGKPWSISHGIGRWVYRLHDPISPIIKNKRVLDLGSNTGVLPLIMLMSGAKEVIGVELDELNYQTSLTYKKSLEWNLNKKFNLDMINKNMMEVIKWDNEYFDVITLYCSIYYLSEREIQLLLEWIKKHSKFVVIEANQASSVEHRKDLANILYIKNVLIKNKIKIISEDEDKESLRPYIIGSM